MNYSYAASVVRVIDGDTLEVDIDLGFHLTKRTALRLAHIDAPEHNTAEGQKAIDFVELWLGKLPATVVVDTYKPADKYGRYLAEVRGTGTKVSLGEALLREGLAVPYEGGKKA